MEAIRAYLLSVTAAAVFCAITRTLAEKGKFSGLCKLVSGLFLAFTVLAPLADIRLGELPGLTGQVQTDAQAAAAAGESYTQAALAQCIIEKTRAYILDKAAAYGTSVQAEITLDESLTPSGCCITGDLSPYVRQRLQTMLEEDLGIPKENQQWRN